MIETATHRRSAHRRSHRTAQENCSQIVELFANDDEMLQSARELFEIREQISNNGRMDSSKKRTKDLLEEEIRLNRRWHRAFGSADSAATICQLCLRLRLNRIEREILAAIVLNHLSLLDRNLDRCADVMLAVGGTRHNPLHVLRLLSEQGRLVKSGLIEHDDLEEDLPNRTVMVAPKVTDLLALDEDVDYLASTEHDLYDNLSRLTCALSQKNDQMRFNPMRSGSDNIVRKWTRVVKKFLDKLDRTLRLHRTWKLNQLRAEVNNDAAWIMVLALLGKELGHNVTDDQLFTGAGLGRAASHNLHSMSSRIRLLSSGGELVRKELVQPCTGSGDLLSDNPADLAEIQYELTDKAMRVLDLSKRAVGKCASNFTIRPATVRMDQLVLSTSVREALNLVEVHAQHASHLLNDWGLGTTISYGHGPVLMFSGLPGTGKTAAAEALAHRLGQPILTADYSQIQSCWVGQTEKNIVRVFREATRHGAVLFWDEADAMFFDRDAASRNWEVRDVNLLLQETERFDGVCILATNRKATLDKALERRITLKVEFERPGRSDRRLIWRKLLPKKLPLENDVDLNQLSAPDLSGGEIKNVVLNAARLALRRSVNGPVSMRHFRRAIEMEEKGQWSGNGSSRIGF